MSVQIIDIVDDMSNKKYHSFNEYFSSTFVKNTAKRDVEFAIYNRNSLDPNSRPLIVGDAFHELMRKDGQRLLNERFYTLDDSEVLPDLLEAYHKRTGKHAQNIYMSGEYKRWKEENEQSDKIFLSLEEWNTIHAMRAKVMEHPIVKAFLPYLVAEERSYFAEWNGIKVRVRPDAEFTLTKDIEVDGIAFKAGNYIFDWKSVQELEKFDSQAHGLKYPVQATFYAKVVGIPYQNFIFIASEKKNTNDCAFKAMKPETIEYAENQMKLALIQIKEYIGSGTIKNSNKPLVEVF